MHALQRLVQLLRVTQQEQVRGAGRGGQGVGQRHLAGLVDAEHVNCAVCLFARPKPRSSANDIQESGGQAVASVVGAFQVLEALGGGLVVGALADPDVDSPSLRPPARSFPASSPITLWLLAVTPTRFPASTRSTIISAPTVLLPEPGGPWTAR